MHVAYLKNGNKVAVKVQHGWLQEESTIDMFVVESLANTAKWMFPAFDYDFIVHDMKKNIPEELNFMHEAENSNRIAKHFVNDPRIKVPHVYEEFSSVYNTLQSQKFLQWNS